MTDVISICSALMPPVQYVALMGRMSRPSLIGTALTLLVGDYLFQHFGVMGVFAVLCAPALANVIWSCLCFARCHAA